MRKNRQLNCASIGKRSGFTLIELLVVCAIMALLAAVLFPVFTAVRERAQATTCLSNSKQIAAGWHMYIQDNDETLPMYAILNAAGTSAIYGWQVCLMPYIKSKQVFVCPTAKPNPRDASGVLNPGCDPTNVSTTGHGSGSYGYNYQFLGYYYLQAGVRYGMAFKMATIQNPAQTVALTEITSLAYTSATYNPTQWNNPSGHACGAIKFVDQIATRHRDGNNVVWVDGHAKWMSLRALGDSDGNGTLDDGYWDRS